MKLIYLGIFKERLQAGFLYAHFFDRGFFEHSKKFPNKSGSGTTTAYGDVSVYFMVLTIQNYNFFFVPYRALFFLEAVYDRFAWLPLLWSNVNS